MDRKEQKIINKWISIVCAEEEIDFEHELSLEWINRSYQNDNWLKKAFHVFLKIEEILEKNGIKLTLVLSILLSDLQTIGLSKTIKKSDLSGCLLEHLPSFSLLPEFQFMKILELGEDLDLELDFPGFSHRVIEWKDSEDPNIVHRSIYFFKKY